VGKQGEGRRAPVTRREVGKGGGRERGGGQMEPVFQHGGGYLVVQAGKKKVRGRAATKQGRPHVKAKKTARGLHLRFTWPP